MDRVESPPAAWGALVPLPVMLGWRPVGMPGQLRAPLGGIPLLVYIPPPMSSLEAIYYIASTLPERERAAFTAETIAKFKAAGGVIADGETPQVAEPRPKLAAKAASRETTGRATAEPRRKKPASKVRARKAPAVPDLTTVRTLAAYETLKKVDLSDPALSEDERASLANGVMSTRRSLRQHGVDPGPSDALVRAAQRILQAQYRERKKATLDA